MFLVRGGLGGVWSVREIFQTDRRRSGDGEGLLGCSEWNIGKRNGTLERWGGEKMRERVIKWAESNLYSCSLSVLGTRRVSWLKRTASPIPQQLSDLSQQLVVPLPIVLVVVPLPYIQQETDPGAQVATQPQHVVEQSLQSERERP